MEVREATTDDVEGISFFFINSWKKVGIGALGWTGASEETISQISDHAFLSNLLNNDNIRIHLAFKENEITGFSALRISRDCVELSGIIV